MAFQAGLLALFLLTAVAVTLRPKGIWEGVWPLLAVVLALLAGILTLADASRGIRSSLDVLAFFAGLLLLAGAIRSHGALGGLLDRVERWSGTSTRRLLLTVAAATVVVTALLSNDAAALILAPELFARLRRRGLSVAPFALLIAFIANAASLLLPISNPVNLLILDRSNLALAVYLPTVSPAAVVAVLITAVACLPAVARLLPSTTAPAPMAAWSSSRPTRARWWLATLLFALIVTDVVFAAFRLPIGPPTLGAGLVAATVVSLEGAGMAPLRNLSWSILALVAGFAVLASGLARAGWLAHAAASLAGAGGWLSGFYVGMVTAGISGGINNLPDALLVTSALQGGGHHVGPPILAAITGADLGPNLAPLGSLSTILILAAARRSGEPVSWSRTLRLGLLIGPLALVPSLVLVAFNH